MLLVDLVLLGRGGDAGSVRADLRPYERDADEARRGDHGADDTDEALRGLCFHHPHPFFFASRGCRTLAIRTSR
ncbi:hypothetical protein DEI83_04310 [Curtobacterium sp. MCBD17_021]|nr:hypothetical protein DEI83_04310 [Curtobacterium sp. MCBD17_021]